MHGQPSTKSQTSERNEGTKCGRRWTASQLQRKRQLDRESQRVSREKTRNRISYLEGLVKSFQENDDDRVQKLLKKIDEQAAEIQKLRDVIRGVNRLIEGSDTTSSSTDSVPEPETPKDDDFSVIGHGHAQNIMDDTPNEYMVLSCEPNEIESVMSLPIEQPMILEDLGSTNIQNHSSNRDSHTVAQLAASIAEDHYLDGRLWYLAGGVLRYLLQARDTSLESSISTCDDEDIAIRAVFEGWPAVTNIYHLDSGWQWLKELDERIYHHLSAHSRLVHIRNTRLVFVNQICPHPNIERQIPSFFLTKSSRSLNQYDRLSEHFPWPGFRQQLLLSPLKFATDRFMDNLRTCFDFTWNRGAHELYVRSPLDGRYRYSDNLVRRMMDIRCYAAKREFFHAFPELRTDIPCSEVSVYSLLPLVEENDIEVDNETVLLHDDGQEHHF